MIIWSGMGKVVPAIGIIAMFIFVPLGMWLGGERSGAAMGVIAAGVVSGLLVFLVARGGEARSAAMIAAGQDPGADNTPGSFFFIPTKLWGSLLPVVGLVLGFMTLNGQGG